SGQPGVRPRRRKLRARRCLPSSAPPWPGSARPRASADQLRASTGIMSFPDSFTTARLRAERLTPAHFDAVRAMDSDAEYMALLGGTRSKPQTRAYMTKKLRHWDDHGVGPWIRRARAGQGTRAWWLRAPGRAVPGAA